jgi:alpha-mannosidase
MEVSDEKTDAPMLKVSFSPVLKRSEATFEIPFGYIQRPSDGVEVTALRWVDISDDEYGVSLLNDSKYGLDVTGNTVRMTLLRTSYSPDRKADEGKHETSYSIYPHKGNWKEAQSFRRGYEINHPFEAIAVTSPSKGSMPETSSFLQVKPENVVVSCVKKAEDSDDIIVRVYDATGEGAEAKINLGFKAEIAAEVDLMEKESGQLKIENGRISMSLKPFEIKTIIVKTRD